LKKREFLKRYDELKVKRLERLEEGGFDQPLSH
jgi:hypothetical protein